MLLKKNIVVPNVPFPIQVIMILSLLKNDITKLRYT